MLLLYEFDDYERMNPLPLIKYFMSHFQFRIELIIIFSERVGYERNESERNCSSMTQLPHRIPEKIFQYIETPSRSQVEIFKEAVSIFFPRDKNSRIFIAKRKFRIRRILSLEKLLIGPDLILNSTIDKSYQIQLEMCCQRKHPSFLQNFELEKILKYLTEKF